MKRHNFKKLQIWTDSMKIVNKTYKLTSLFPDYEKFGLKSQMNRCAVSIPSNIAEGTSKSSNKHLAQFLEISLGSAFEFETQLIIASELNYMDKKLFIELEDEIKLLQRKISNFIDRIKSNPDS